MWQEGRKGYGKSRDNCRLTKTQCCVLRSNVWVELPPWLISKLNTKLIKKQDLFLISRIHSKKQPPQKKRVMYDKYSTQVNTARGTDRAGASLFVAQVELTVDCWVKATALTRIVYSDRHWKFATCHVHVARCYQDLQGAVYRCALYLPSHVLLISSHDTQDCTTKHFSMLRPVATSFSHTCSPSEKKCRARLSLHWPARITSLEVFSRRKCSILSSSNKIRSF